MSATREHRNAALIEKNINDARNSLEEAHGLYDELAAHLPDDFPVLFDEFDAAEKAVERLLEKAK